MSHKRNKVYIPKPSNNPEKLRLRVETKVRQLQAQVDQQQCVLKAVNKANDAHLEQLSNFIHHDTKNAIQSLDGLVYAAYKVDAILPEDLYKQFRLAIEMLNNSLKNFAKLIPSTQEEYTTMPDVLNAVEMLSRGEIQKKMINIDFLYDRNDLTKLNLSFQSLVQVLHNFVINAMNALAFHEDKHIKVVGVVNSTVCEVRVYDNANVISENEKMKIFEYGYSTTNGTGVGLYHAKYLADEMHGIVDVLPSDIDGYTKYFILELPY